MYSSQRSFIHSNGITFVDRRYDFLSRVIVGVSVQAGAAEAQLDSAERIAALEEAERLLREVTELFEQRFE